MESGNDKTVLYVLSIGLDHDNEPLFSLEQEPWSSLSKNALRPAKNSDLVKEVRRRATMDPGAGVGVIREMFHLDQGDSTVDLR